MKDVAEICARLRKWPHVVMPDQRTLARECLERTCELFDCQRAVLVIEEGEEPWVVVAETGPSGFEWREEEDVDFDSLVPASLGECGFIAEALQPGVERVFSGANPVEQEIEDAVHPMIRSVLSDARVLSIPVLSESVRGRMYISDPDVARETALCVGEPLGVIISQRFEASSQIRAAVRDAVEQDHIRVARDLHDGLLQSFTGVVLQLETIHSLLEEHPDEARRMITETQGLIMADQRELRRFVEHLRPRPGYREAKFDFAASLEDLRSRFANQWKIRVVFDVVDIDPLVSMSLGQETFRLIHEAVTNSAKHGGASDVRVGVRTAGSEMHIEVADNGTGFPFHGRLTLDQMRETGRGPRVLAERVASLNGNLVVESTESGATVSISVPLGWGGPSTP